MQESRQLEEFGQFLRRKSLLSRCHSDLEFFLGTVSNTLCVNVNFLNKISPLNGPFSSLFLFLRSRAYFNNFDQEMKSTTDIKMVLEVTKRLFCLFVILDLVNMSRCSLLGIELDEAGEEFLNEYLSLGESKYMAEPRDFGDTAIEIDLMDRKKHRLPHQEPRVLYQIGDSEEELPICSERSEVCSKVDLYGAPWLERQCRCPGGRTCPSSLHADDGYTIVDKTRQYKLCKPVKRLPICRYFKDVTWTLAPGGGPANATVQRVHCRCRPGSVPYLVRRQPHRTHEGNPGFIYAFACSPQSRLRCQHKEPCRLFTVRKRRNSQLEEVNASPLCHCPKGHRCPRRHTDPGSLPARSYSGILEIKTYSGYCVPAHHHSEPIYTV